MFCCAIGSRKNHAARPARIVSVLDFAAPFKQAADELDWSGQVAGNGRLFTAVRQLVEQALAREAQRDDLTVVLLRRVRRDGLGGPPDEPTPIVLRPGGLSRGGVH